MKPITIELKEDNGIDRCQEPLCFGVPLPRGALQDGRQLSLNIDDRPLPLQIDVQARWPDGSLRWILVQTLVSLGAHQSQQLVLKAAREPWFGKSRIVDDWLASSATGWTFHTETMQHHLDRQTGQLQSLSLDPARNNPDADPELGPMNESTSHPWDLVFHLLNASTDAPWRESVESISWPRQIGPLSAQVELKGCWRDAQQRPRLRFERRLTFYRHNGLVVVEECLHNPRRARHSGGLWDLGDPGSEYLIDFHVDVTHPDIKAVRLQAEPEQPTESRPEALSGISVYQDSSGGKNWNSRNHIDSGGQLTPQFRGYQLHIDRQCTAQGLRAQPVAEVTSSDGLCSLAMPEFWQNFPKFLGASDTGLRLGLFPRESEQRYELQGGERKTARFCIGYQMPMSKLQWSVAPLTPVVSAQAYRDAGVFDWFSPDTTQGDQTDNLTELLTRAIDAPQSLLDKREIIDEYGWRHFGDLFADHEARHQAPDEAPLISHYNNQYDAAMGFARQFAVSGDHRWFRLFHDLARHVTDIDLYHTDEDRPEYNHGMFWHTDHYLPAQTATHRTFSRLNAVSSTPGQTGGGPAAEHCYTSGLLMHYWMTGDRASRQAVIDLADWMIRLHEGAPGLLSQLLACKKQEWTHLKRLWRGRGTHAYTYPFTRGTGNYLLALIDAHQVTGSTHYLSLARQVVHRTCHPNDEVEQRQLLDVENHWSYLIFLSALVTYHEHLRRLHETDAEVVNDPEMGYVRACLTTYTRWMLDNEEPFLTRAELLEFPNETWVAQDLRKVMLWYVASLYDPAWREAYLAKAEAWQQTIVQTLAASPYRAYTRIQVVILQQTGPQSLRHQPLAAIPYGDRPAARVPLEPSPALTRTILLRRMMRRLCRAVWQFRPTREKAWLRARWDRP